MCKFLIIQPMNENEKVSTEDKKEIRFWVDMILYLLKHFRPHIANETRELSTANDGESPAAFKESLHVSKCVLDVQKKLELKINHGK